MQGKQLIRQVSPLIKEFYIRLLSTSGFTHEDITAVILHQASRVGLTLMQREMNIAQEKVIDIYRHRGNQVAASIPSVLHEASITGRLLPGKPVVLFGTAAGLSLGGWCYYHENTGYGRYQWIGKKRSGMAATARISGSCLWARHLG